MRNILLCLYLIAAIKNGGFGQQEYSLDDILLMAEELSIYHHQALADNAVAQSRWGLHQANLKPGITLDILAPNFIKTSREIVQPDGSIRFQSVSQNNSSVGLTLQQQIVGTGATVFLQSDLQRFDDFSNDGKFYNGVPLRIGFFQPIGGFNSLKWNNQIRPLELKVANKQYVVDIERIHLLGAQRYFDLLIAQVNLRMAIQNSEVNETLVTIANERYALGKISRNELLQLQLELKTSNKSKSVAAYRVDLQEGALWTFLGKSSVDSIALKFPTPFDKIIKIDPYVALSHATTNRPEIIQFERQLLESNRDIKRAKVDYGIQANLSASFGYARGSDRLKDIYASPISEQQLQLSLTIPILDWGRKKNAVAMAAAQLELTEQQIAQNRLDFENEIIQMVGAFEQLQQEVLLQKDISEVAAQRFEISRERYVLGDISITDLTIAQREKDQALTEYIESLRAYWVTYYQLRVLTGYDFLNDRTITYNN